MKLQHSLKKIGLFCLIAGLMIGCKTKEEVVETVVESTKESAPVAACSMEDKIGEIQKSTLVYTNRDLDYDKDLGYTEGMDFPDMTLYFQNGKPFNVHNRIDEMQKPFLLISGSFTCPIYRLQLEHINDLHRIYKNELMVFVVYIVEAHPSIDESPYKNEEWQVPSNIKDSAVYRQATTFGERVATATAMRRRLGLEPKLVFDGPDNTYWHTMGQAPVFAYLIGTDKKIKKYQFAFEREAMDYAIRELLGLKANED